MNFSHQFLLSVLIFFGTGCSSMGSIKSVENRLIIENLVIGEGAEAQDYNKVVVNYTGTLEDGSVFDSSLNPDREPFTFTLGVGSVIKGWDLGYGDKGAGNLIPPGATLIFEVELLEVEAY